MKKLILTLSCFLILSLGIGHAKMINGVVTDQMGEGLPGVSVVIKGTSNSVITDMTGKYSIDANDGQQLTYNLVGFGTEVVTVADETNYDIMMGTGDLLLDEVVAVGYGTVKKSDLTGAVAVVDAKALSSQPALSSATEALQGRAAGVTVKNTSGSPGETPTVNIRGVSTINNAQPVYVVDGILMDDISFLPPDAIESMDILKDASSTAIYGSRGANGVIIVKTKKGVAGKTQVTYSGSYGVQTFWKSPDMMNTEDYLKTMELGTGSPTVLESPMSADVSTNWWDEVTQLGLVNNQNVSIGGGTENGTYRVGVGYFDQRGIVDASGFTRTNIQLQGSTKKGIVTVGTDVNLYTTDRDITPINLGVVQRTPPAMSPTNAEGEYQGFPGSVGFANPAALPSNTFENTKTYGARGSGYITIDILPELKFQSRLGGYVTNSHNEIFKGTFDYTNNGAIASSSYNTRTVSSLEETEKTTTNWQWVNTLEYNKDINKHSINALIGYTAESWWSNYTTGEKQQLLSNDPDARSFSAANELISLEGKPDQQSIASFMGRANYGYDDKYLFTATVRVDGSSVFPADGRYGVFPAFAGAWKIHNESFMKNISTISSAKLRMGWGKVGNQNVPRYQYLAFMGKSQDYNYPQGSTNAGSAVSFLPNPNFGWEEVISMDMGLEVGLLSNSILFSIDIFSRTTNQMLLNPVIPDYAGIGSAGLINLGSVKNQGIELTASWRKQINKDLSINVSGNLTSLRNEIVSLGSETQIDVTSSNFAAIGNTFQVNKVGQSIGSFYGYEVEGVFNTDAEAAADPDQGNYAKAGDFNYKTNGDGVLNEDDEVFLGKSIPNLTWGLTLGTNYKNFDFSVFFTGVTVNKIANTINYYLKRANSLDNKVQSLLSDSWTTENTGNQSQFGYQNSQTAQNYNTSNSWYIEDGSYMRLRNLQIGYTLPTALSTKWKINKCRFYVSGENLWTVTSYSGLDPEVGDGIDRGIYPQPITYTVGVNLSF